jgi:type IV secretory pathway VirB2 component (pilin)
MKKLFGIVGNIAGGLGILICLVAGLARLAGSFYLFKFEVVTLFIGGIALMVMACLVKLQQLLTP